MSRALLSSIALLFVACTGGSDPNPTDPNDKTGLEDGPYCEATETEVALDEVTPLGFAPQILVDLAEGEHLATMTWLDERTADLTVTATLDGRVLFVDQEPVYPTGTGTYPDIAVICEDSVAIEGTLQVITADGLLDETMEVTFRSSAGTVVDADAELDPDGLTGSLVFDDFHEEVDYDTRSLRLAAHFVAEGTSGEVAGMVQGSEDCEDGEACTAWASVFALGTWGTEER